MNFTLLLILLMFLSPSDKPIVGEPAPNFSGLSTGGKTITLEDFKGSWVILYFYPKAFTRGCTIESCGLRDSYAELSKLNAKVIGVSFDDIEKQEEFKKANELPFDLISDKDKSIAKSYDTVGILKLYAKRKTFLIDPEGKLAYIFDKVDTATHPQDIIDVLTGIINDSN
ncbi:MAG: peroxiredoxin [Candidatus Marinimicrobia bacterium]|nr:peroxiredoxin [Candidatus Neomarinimicrobiota bacterium]